MILFSGNEKVLRILLGELIPPRTPHANPLNRELLYICKNLRVQDILPHLLQNKLISDNDFKSLSTKSIDFDAAMDLIPILPNRLKNWYPAFMLVLIESDHKHIAEKIDKTLTIGKQSIFTDLSLSIEE